MSSSALFIKRMLVRELWGERKTLIVSLLPIVFAVAIIASLGTLREVVVDSLQQEERALTGADITLSIRGKPTKAMEEFKQKLPGQQVLEVDFPSMLRVPSSEQARLVAVEGFDSSFPFYGERVTSPPKMGDAYLDGKSVLIDEALSLQFALSVGDQVQLGDSVFRVAAIVLRSPGEVDFRSSIAPKVIALISSLENAGLLTHGIRQRTKIHYKLPPGYSGEKLHQKYEKEARSLGLRLDTPETRRERLGEVVSRVYSFLNLFSVATLLIGALGAVAGGVYYSNKKRKSVAVLRCMGAGVKELLTIYVGTFSLASLLFSVAGLLLSIPLLTYMRWAFAEFLPKTLPQLLFPDSYFSLLALAIGLFSPLVFAMPPILALRQISPIEAFREEVQSAYAKQGFGLGLILIAVGVMLLSGELLIGKAELTLAFSISLVVLVALQLLLGSIFRKVSKRLRFKSPFFALNHAVSNFFRPGNETLFLSVIIGVPFFLGLSFWSLQTTLSSELSSILEQNDENLALFDIQSDQREIVEKLSKSHGVTLKQWYPLVSMRISAINGQSVEDMRENEESGRRRWYLSRQYRNTYRSNLLRTETLLSGSMPESPFSGEGLIPITIERRMQENLELNLGDKLSFDVQGLELETQIVGVRKFNFRGVNPGFFVVFPEGVLEDAPSFDVVTARADDLKSLVGFQKALASEASNISLVNSEEVKQTIESVFLKLKAVVDLLALVIFLAAAFVVFSTIQLTSSVRISEYKLYKMLGAKKSTLMSMTIIEFFILGILACSVGAIVTNLFALATSLLYSDFNITTPNLGFVLSSLVLSSLVSIVGYFGVRSAKASQ